MTPTELAELDNNISRNRDIVARGQALERLQKHPDYKLIIGDGYLNTEAVRLVLLKGDMNMQKPDRQADIAADIDAVGRFNAYLDRISRMSALAAESIREDEKTREDVLSESAQLQGGDE
jgi:hypothetical protein